MDELTEHLAVRKALKPIRNQINLSWDTTEFAIDQISMKLNDLEDGQTEMPV